MVEEEYLKSAHKILKQTLYEFDRVCVKYGIPYYLICGSLLGAVRHRDLIPWDDDVDVALTRDGFEKLQIIAEREWDGTEYLWLPYQNMGKGVFLDFMNRLVYMKDEIPVNIFNKIRGKGRDDIQNHLAIDIYILDNASDDEKKHRRQTKRIMGYYGLAMGHRAYINYSEYKNTDGKTRCIIRILSSIGRWVPLQWIFHMYEKECKRYNKIDTMDYFESNGWIYCISWRFNQKWFGEGRRLLLGEKYVMAPKACNSFLKKHYGDYMKLPPEDKRKPTHAATATGIYH